MTIKDSEKLKGSNETGFGFRDFVEFTGEDPAQVVSLAEETQSPRNTWRVRSATARRYFAEKGADFSFRLVSHINMRGGIGKTTATVALASRAAQAGFKTCVLDLDSQASASLALGVTAADDDTVFYDVWQNPAELLAAALREVNENLFLLPSSLQNGLLDSALASPVSQKNAVRGIRRTLENLGFDLVVVDCPPSLGAAVISAICASDAIVIPTGADAFSFKGIELTLGEIRSICETFGLEIPATRILFSKFDRRERVSMEALEKLEREYREFLIPSVIRVSSEFNKALAKGGTIFAGAAKSKAREDYDGYVRSVLELPFNPSERLLITKIMEKPAEAPAVFLDEGTRGATVTLLKPLEKLDSSLL